MADSRFFHKSSSFTLRQLAEITGSRLINGQDDFLIDDVASLGAAGDRHVTFFENNRYKDAFINTKASACFVSEKVAESAPKHLTLLVSGAPYKAFARASQAFYPEVKPSPSISKHAFIEDSVSIGKDVTIDAGAIIKSGAKIGVGSWIESGAVIGANVEIGNNCRIGTNASLSHCLIGNNVRLYSGVCVGQDGFGFAIDPNGHVKIPQLGRVIIGDYCEIGSNTTIDRGAGPDTIIGKGCWIDNLVQIGHNVKMGRGCIIVSQVGISGSTVIGDFVVMGGQCGVAGHLNIGTGARLGAQSGILRDVPAGQELMGTPAVPIKQFMRQVAKLSQIIKK